MLGKKVLPEPIDQCYCRGKLDPSTAVSFYTMIFVASSYTSIEDILHLVGYPGYTIWNSSKGLPI
jgi:hypothetical protein